jgi:serine/threonine protein phosphatase PrpC
VREQGSLTGSGRSHAGIVRAENQDRCVRFASPCGEVVLVADGMGGAQGGATAAQMVVDGFQSQLLSLPATMPYADALQEAARSVAAQVHLIGSSGDPKVAGMGSTVVLALISGARLVVAHIGDSRAYLYRGLRLIPLTRDHTVVQRMVDAGMISEDAARCHPDASVLSRAIGQTAQVDLEISAPIELEPGDGVLLCSDGLSGYVDDLMIEETLKGFETTPEEAVSALIQLALQTGGEDNVTVQYIHVPYSQSAIPETVDTSSRLVERRSARHRFFRKSGFVAAAIVLAALVMYGLVWRSRGRVGAGLVQPASSSDKTVGGGPNPK